MSSLTLTPMPTTRETPNASEVRWSDGALESLGTGQPSILLFRPPDTRQQDEGLTMPALAPLERPPPPLEGTAPPTSSPPSSVSAAATHVPKYVSKYTCAGRAPAASHATRGRRF
jgi:hypothetical protein